MKITKDMVSEFNLLLSKVSCIFKLEFGGEISESDMRIIVANDTYINRASISPNEEFYDLIKAFFNEKGIELSMNNTGDIFWSKS